MSEVHAQSRGARVGIVSGYVSNDQVWTPAMDTEAVGGLVLGAYINASTPTGWLSITLEGAYTQRGGDVFGLSDDSEPSDRNAIRADYLTFSLQPRATIALGPVDGFLTTGPTLDQLMRSRLSPELSQEFGDGRGTVFAWTVGVGAGVSITDRVYGEVEARIVRGLGDAYDGDFITVRNQSLEIVGRVGIPWPAN